MVETHQAMREAELKATLSEFINILRSRRVARTANSPAMLSSPFSASTEERMTTPPTSTAIPNNTVPISAGVSVPLGVCRSACNAG